MNKKSRFLACLIFLAIICVSSLVAAASVTVKWKFVNLRESPTEKAPIITRLVQGVSVTILGEEKEWYNVKTEEDITGWLVMESVRVSAPPATHEPEASKAPAAVAPAAETKPDNKAEPVEKEESDGEFLTYKEKNENKEGASEENAGAEKPEPEGEKSAVPDQESYLNVRESTVPQMPSLTASFFRMLSALLIVIGVILSLYYVIRKYFSKTLLSFEGSSAITVLASKYIGQKTILYVIDVIEKVVVIAMSGTDIRVITEISDPSSIERIRSQISRFKEGEKPFKRMLFDKVKATKKGSSFEAKEENFDILDEINEKIKQKVDDFEI